MPPRSKAWLHFSKIDATHVQCNICKKVIVAKASNTTNLMKHLTMHEVKVSYWYRYWTFLIDTQSYKCDSFISCFNNESVSWFITQRKQFTFFCSLANSFPHTLTTDVQVLLLQINGAVSQSVHTKPRSGNFTVSTGVKITLLLEISPSVKATAESQWKNICPGCSTLLFDLV